MHVTFCWGKLHICVAICLLINSVSGKRNYNIYMPSKTCSNIPREIDGAVITSTSSNYLYANSGCRMTFMSDDDLFTSKKIMVKVENMYITNCDVRLRFFDSSSTSGLPIKSLDCRSLRPSVFYSTGKYLSIRLDKKSNSGYSFRIILTTVERKRYCKGDEISCGVGYCADNDLRCDGVAHCPYKVDEQSCSNFQHNVNVNFGAMAGLGIAVFFVCVIGIVVTVIFCRRRGYTGRVLRSSQNTSITSTTVVPPPPPGPQPPFQQPGYGVPYPQQPPAYSYPQQSPQGMYPPPNPAPGYPQAQYPPPAYPGYPQGPPAVNYDAHTEQAKVPY